MSNILFVDILNQRGSSFGMMFGMSLFLLSWKDGVN